MRKKILLASCAVVFVGILGLILVGSFSRSSSQPKTSTTQSGISKKKRAGLPKSGYLLQNLRVTRATATHPSTYSIENNPAEPSGITRTGDDSFYIDDTGIIRHSGSPEKPAGPRDQPVH